MGIPQLFQGNSMKTITIALLFLILSSTTHAVETTFTGYLRGGSGLNMQGGHMNCFGNAGMPGNFLRLGNECDFYTELAMVFHHVKPTETDPVFFKTQFRMVYSSLGTRQWEAAANRDTSQIEAFVKAGGFTEIPGEFWVGKRFYRDVDLHIFDWYYYADMSGVGAGIEGLPLGEGRFAFAHLIQADDNLNDTNVGRPVLNALDLRWTAVPSFADQKLNFWGVYAWAAGSSTDTEEYVPTNGYSLATRLQGPVWGGNNNFAILYGKGTMRGFNIYADSTVPATDESQNRAWTWRFVEDYTYDVTDRWALMFGLAAEIADSGTDTDSKSQMQAIGVRPIYFVSDRFQWAFEAGYSRINNESEKTGGGDYVGDRDLGRVTAAAQLSVGKSMWGRPVMRAFVSHSFWNDANQGANFIGNRAPAFSDKLSGTNLGYQFEAWF